MENVALLTKGTLKLRNLITINLQSNKWLRLLSVGLITFIAQFNTAMMPIASAAVAPPTYGVQFIVDGSRKAVNALGQVVGWSTVDTVSRAWVFAEDSGLIYLPVPTGWYSNALDINDNGVIVGYASATELTDGRTADGLDGGAVQWTPATNGYEMQLMTAVIVDGEGSTAIGINNLGDIIGSRTFRTEIVPGMFTIVSVGFLLQNDGTYISNLNDVGFLALPLDINDAGSIVGGSLRMTNGIVENLGSPSGYGITFINAINNAGQVAASSVFSTSTTRTATRYTDGIGWEILSTGSSEDASYGINDLGDVAFSAGHTCTSRSATAPMIRLEGVGTFCVQDLITDQNWILRIPSYGNQINLNRQLILNAQNQLTGESGAVLLTINGELSVPLAAQNLTAIALETAFSIGIELNWTDASDLEKSFRIERAPFNGTFVEIGIAPTNISSYKDNAAESGVTYEYRVFAVGLAGDSLSSNIATATAPVPVAPTAAQNLTGVIHEATIQQPWIAIELNWTDTSDNEQGFRIERAPLNGVFAEIGTTFAPNIQSYTDLTIEPNVTYEYRVFAFGLASDSLSSNVITVTTSAMKDTEAPMVFFTSPLNGEQISVSNSLTIMVNATDNIAVSNVKIDVIVNGSTITICEVFEPTTAEVSCSWNLKKLKLTSGTYLFTTTADDALGNFGIETISVDLIVPTKTTGGGGGGGGNDGGGGGKGKGKN